MEVPEIPIETTLKCDNLTVGYKSRISEKIILKDVNFSVSKGSFVSMVGINGSGKSTLLRTLAGIQNPLSGTISLENQILNSIKPTKKSKLLSLVLTNQLISKNLTVLELITLGRQPHTNWIGSLSSIDKKHILEALKATELEDLKNTPCFELSDGQLQRVLIARALAQDTPVIFLDEPTTHLDLHHKASIFLLLKKIAQEQEKTILCTTHDIELILSLCDKMVVLHNKTTYTDTPGVLIKSGIFEKLFPDDKIGFNSKSHQFFIR